MRSLLCLLASLVALTGGCASWQANRGSQAVDFDPFALGSGESALRPSNGPGFINGDAQDMRTRR
jgi:hypothetical protein